MIKGGQWGNGRKETEGEWRKRGFWRFCTDTDPVFLHPFCKFPPLKWWWLYLSRRNCRVGKGACGVTPSRPALRPPQTGPGGSREVLGAAPRHQVASLFCACVSSLGEAEGSSPACSNFLTHLVEVSYGAPPLSSLYLSLHTFPPCLLFLCDTRMVVSHGCKTVCLCPGSLGGNQVRVHASSFVLTIFPLFLSLFPSRSFSFTLSPLNSK